MKINNNLSTNKLPQVSLSQDSRKTEAEAESLLGGYNKKEIDKYLKEFETAVSQQPKEDPCYLFKKFWQNLFGKNGVKLSVIF